MPAADTRNAPDASDAPAHVRCAQLRPGMNYREAMTIMGREPDNTLSGHSAAGPGGDPPAGSFGIDFWYDTGDDGERRTTSMRYSGGVVETVDCGAPAPGSDTATNGER
ncbi:hypothetical protein [Luteimonas kalidii]|uniref:Lipoprotein SmpA/OmlA domain-containing protein n=1 Tax=Luteimonas kalidii TaxID=3042025 RepID=A0ABT6JT00_9GAMM|nr:hypothetical protein [Luteimonas kalidii]MDH5833810.1 hypothetical protein [Luteimonas kalidii]